MLGYCEFSGVVSRLGLVKAVGFVESGMDAGAAHCLRD